MIPQSWTEIAYFSALIWFNAFFFVATLLSVATWYYLSKINKKVQDTSDMVQGVAMHVYEGFGSKKSEFLGGIGSLLGGFIWGNKKKK